MKTRSVTAGLFRTTWLEKRVSGRTSKPSVSRLKHKAQNMIWLGHQDNIASSRKEIAPKVCFYLFINKVQTDQQTVKLKERTASYWTGLPSKVHFALTKYSNMNQGWPVEIHIIYLTLGPTTENIIFVSTVPTLGENLKSKSRTCFKNLLKESIVSSYWFVH